MPRIPIIENIRRKESKKENDRVRTEVLGNAIDTLNIWVYNQLQTTAKREERMQAAKKIARKAKHNNGVQKQRRK